MPTMGKCGYQSLPEKDKRKSGEAVHNNLPDQEKMVEI